MKSLFRKLLWLYFSSLVLIIIWWWPDCYIKVLYWAESLWLVSIIALIKSCLQSVYHFGMRSVVKCLSWWHNKRAFRFVRIMLNVKQRSYEYQFLSHRFHPTWNQTRVYLLDHLINYYLQLLLLLALMTFAFHSKWTSFFYIYQS